MMFSRTQTIGNKANNFKYKSTTILMNTGARVRPSASAILKITDGCSLRENEQSCVFRKARIFRPYLLKCLLYDIKQISSLKLFSKKTINLAFGCSVLMTYVL